MDTIIIMTETSKKCSVCQNACQRVQGYECMFSLGNHNENKHLNGQSPLCFV